MAMPLEAGYEYQLWLFDEVGYISAEWRCNPWVEASIVTTDTN